MRRRFEDAPGHGYPEHMLRIDEDAHATPAD
jgi:hypothetical protein